MTKKKNEPYRVCSSKFIGRNEFEGYESYTYELTFNKSLEHTGRFTGIEEGLNAYVKREAKEDFKNSFVNVWRSFVRWINSL